MKKLPDKKAVEDIARELGVDESFIEKDWYAIEVLKALSCLQDDKFTPVFSGGTSLSKGYALIERFSEDLDFKISYSGEEKRPELRAFRERVLGTIGKNDSGIVIQKQDSKDESRFFSCQLEYPKQFKLAKGLRPELKLEFTFRPPHIAPLAREIRSFEAQLRKSAPDLMLGCVQPIETAADKLSAFMWRVKDRNRSRPGDDPAIIRHLHDLAKLKETIIKEKPTFLDIATKAYEADRERLTAQMPATLAEGVEQLISQLEADALYKKEYEEFVAAVCYGAEENKLKYALALASLKEISKTIKS